MAEWNSAKIRKLKERYDKIVSKRKVSDYELAKLMTSFRDALNSTQEFIPFCTDHAEGLGLSATTAHMYRRMIVSLEKVDSEGVWKAVGWDGIRKIVRIEAREEALTVCRTLLREGKSSRVSQARLDHIMTERAPSYRPARRPVKPGVKGPTKAEVARERDLYKAELLALVAKWDQLKRDISAEVRKKLGLRTQ